MKKFAFILAGCGGLDGTEVHEALYAFLSVKQQGCDYVCFAANRKQEIVKDYISNKDVEETRNILKESARLTKNNIKELYELKVEDFDALFFPGGLGSAMNISTFIIDGKDYIVDINIKEIILEFKKQNKPICAVCIAPMILVKTLKCIKLTIGNDNKIAKLIKKLGNTSIKTTSGQVCVDVENKVITAPCFMLTKDITIVYDEIYSVVKEAIKLMN